MFPEGGGAELKGHVPYKVKKKFVDALPKSLRLFKFCKKAHYLMLSKTIERYLLKIL